MNRFGRVILVSFLLSAFAISSAVVLARGVVSGGSSQHFELLIADECPGCPFGGLTRHRTA
jgi:hypothetical protein